MSIVRQYDPTYFAIVGNKLTMNPTAPLGLQTSFSYTFDFAGGAYDYTGDANWSPTYEQNDAYVFSERLGDGVHVPWFYAGDRQYSAAGDVQRTSDGFLRLYFPAGRSSIDTFPGSQGPANLWVPLPFADYLQVDVTLRTNLAAVYAAGSAALFAVKLGLVSPQWNSSPYCLPHIHVERGGTNTASNLKEFPQIASTTPQTTPSTTLDSFLSANVLTRQYRFVISGPNSHVYSGQGAVTRFASASRYSHQFRQTFLNLGMAGNRAGITSQQYYADIGALTISGTRSMC